MRLLDLVEQDHAVGLAPHCLGEVAALLVAHVARRRADHARDRVLLHELAHVEADQVVLAVEQERGKRLAQLGLAHARRAEEQEGAGRPVRIGQARARAPDGVGDRERSPRPGRPRARAASRSICSSLSRSPCISLDTGMPVARATTSAISSAPTIVRSSCGLLGALLACLAGLRFLELLLELGQLAVLQLGDLVVVALALPAPRSAKRVLSMSSSSTDCAEPCAAAFSAFQISSRSAILALRAGRSLPRSARRSASDRGLVLLLEHGLALDLQLDQPPVELVDRLGLGVDLDLDASTAASSIRSIALSGRKRSVM